MKEKSKKESSKFTRTTPGSLEFAKAGRNTHESKNGISSRQKAKSVSVQDMFKMCKM